jgi:MoaA/NifB/PqqE/SkfB family radical SAM enzyme
MRIPARNYWINLLRLLRGNRLLRPLAVIYYVTTRCNLNCVYCEDFGARRNAQAETPLSLDDAVRVLRVVRGGADHLILSGGEPLLYPDVTALVHRVRRELNFRQLTLLTNGLLLPQFEAILPALDRLIVSLDAIDPDAWHHVIRAPATTAQTILDNVRTYARRQSQEGYRLIVNCVLTPETLSGAQQVLEFCVEHDVLVSFSPQAVHNWPHYELLVSDSYKAFLTHLMDLKRQGAPILGSMAYLRTLHDMVPYICYPTLLPRVLPNGDLVYPCWPIEKEQGSHGGRPCNLLQTASWEQALAVALDVYGPPPRLCSSCFQQCFAEPSLMQTRPLSLLYEWLRYTPSRQGALWTHSPG